MNGNQITQWVKSTELGDLDKMDKLSMVIGPVSGMFVNYMGTSVQTWMENYANCGI
jgi:hypothetical protein